MNSDNEKEKIIDILKKRLKFYIPFYLLGLIPYLTTHCNQENYVFLPVNLLAIISAIGCGTAAYYGSIQMPYTTGSIRLFKYVLAISIVIIIAVSLQVYLMDNCGINIEPFIGF